MPLNTRELLEAAEVVAECKNMKVTLKYSLLGAVVASMTTFVGGLVAGPIGLLFGATSGGFISYRWANNRFQPAVNVIRNELTQSQQEKLAMHLTNAIKDFDITDAVQLLAAIQTQEALLMLIFTTVKDFFERDLSLTIN